ncbi:hypothetical protein LCGC14_0231460 [marine sediment metagenome]|uniref:Uncharacterized protein n=1 Tax=marine sediment metagenome TaxID=412755 RepID=A0A0F9UEE7_9ZZZZ
MKISYKEWKPQAKTAGVVAKAIDIIDEYEAKGYILTLRQLFYQFVSRDLLPNDQESYNKLGDIIKNARMAGFINWTSLEDRTRFVRENQHWDNPMEILESARRGYAIDKWANQTTRIEVWIEKDALVGVIEGICVQLDVPYFSCRGYPSASEVWKAGQRFNQYIKDGQKVVVLHLGDHDPSGLDMTWDLWKRLAVFTGYDYDQIKEFYKSETAYTIIEFDGDGLLHDAPIIRRLGLNFSQISRYNPPPNYVKFADKRVKNYVDHFGTDSWELDALDPGVINALIKDAILKIRDNTLWNEAVADEDHGKDKIQDFIDQLYDDSGE